MLIYGTADDLADWLTTVPDDPDLLLRRASGIVRHATRAALYDTDSAGKPEDPDVLQAFTDATCAQVAHWASNGIDPTVPTPMAASKSLGDRSIGFAGVDQIAATNAASINSLTTEAWTILSNAGLLDGQPNA